MRRLASLVRRPLGGKRLAGVIAEALGGPCRVCVVGTGAWSTKLTSLGFAVVAADGPLDAALLVEQLEAEAEGLDLEGLPEGARVVSLERVGVSALVEERVAGRFLAAGLRDLAQRTVGSAIVTWGRVGPSLLD